MYGKEKLVCAAVEISNMRPRSAWARGVVRYALDIVDTVCEGYNTVEFSTPAELEGYCLNGARDWFQASEGACYLWYTEDIVDRLCAPWEKRLFQSGKRAGFFAEHVLEWQGRALFQAFQLIREKVFSK